MLPDIHGFRSAGSLLYKQSLHALHFILHKLPNTGLTEVIAGKYLA